MTDVSNIIFFLVEAKVQLCKRFRQTFWWSHNTGSVYVDEHICAVCKVSLRKYVCGCVCVCGGGGGCISVCMWLRDGSAKVYPHHHYRILRNVIVAHLTCSKSLLMYSFLPLHRGYSLRGVQGFYCLNLNFLTYKSCCNVEKTPLHILHIVL